MNPSAHSNPASSRLSRREFTGFVAKSALGALALGSAAGAGAAGAASSNNRFDSTRRGIWKVIPPRRVLVSPTGVPEGQIWRYQLSYPFQVSATQAALSLNMKASPGPGQDFPTGVDILVFDDVSTIRAEDAVAIARNHDEPNPNAGGKMAHMAKFPAQIGFVPGGARLASGQAHPHAGTGFALISAGARPVDDSEGLDNFPDRVGRGAFRGARAYGYMEVHQLALENGKIRPSNLERWKDGMHVDGYELVNRGMQSAIGDGDDLLMALSARRPGAPKFLSGVSRWSRRDGKWAPVAFEPITPEDNSIEPSLIRDVDGSLIFFARGRREAGPPVRLWRKSEPASGWQQTFNRNGIANSTPITLNQAVDGTPYLLMNLYEPPFHLPPEIHSDGGISRIEPKGRRAERSAILLVPLNAARDGLDTPLLAFDPLVEYGVPPHQTVWAADHATGATVRLGDKDWHGLFGFRLLEWIENTHQTGPTPLTGSYLAEVVSVGPAFPPWRF